MKIRLMKDEVTEADYEGYAPVNARKRQRRVTFPECRGGGCVIAGYMLGDAYRGLAWGETIRVTNRVTPHIVFNGSLNPAEWAK